MEVPLDTNDIDVGYAVIVYSNTVFLVNQVLLESNYEKMYTIQHVVPLTTCFDSIFLKHGFAEQCYTFCATLLI